MQIEATKAPLQWENYYYYIQILKLICNKLLTNKSTIEIHGDGGFVLYYCLYEIYDFEKVICFLTKELFNMVVVLVIYSFEIGVKKYCHSKYRIV